jgi:hypothetical protein
MAEPWDGRCTRCGGSGPFTDRKHLCKACYAARVRALRAADPEAHRAKRRAEYARARAADPEGTAEEAHRRWASLSPEALARYRQRHRERLAERRAEDPVGMRAAEFASSARYRERHREALRERQRRYRARRKEQRDADPA